MKRKLFSLAFMLVFAFSASALADDGETGNGGKTPNPPPAEGNRSSNDMSGDLFAQILTALLTIVPK